MGPHGDVEHLKQPLVSGRFGVVTAIFMPRPGSLVSQDHTGARNVTGDPRRGRNSTDGFRSERICGSHGGSSTNFGSHQQLPTGHQLLLLPAATGSQSAFSMSETWAEGPGQFQQNGLGLPSIVERRPEFGSSPCGAQVFLRSKRLTEDD